MKYLSNIVTLELDRARCVGCGRCAEVCPHAVFSLVEKTARIIARDACMECGACARNCPVDAISVRAGVGCATAVIYGMLTGKESCACGTPCCKSL